MNNFNNIKKGDRVKIETQAGDFAEFTVVSRGGEILSSRANLYDTRNIKSLEVVKPPVPTEMGVYRAENGGKRRFILDDTGGWSILYQESFNVDNLGNDFVLGSFHNFTRIEL